MIKNKDIEGIELELQKNRIKKMIVDEIIIAHTEGQPTSRLTSLYNKISINE